MSASPVPDAPTPFDASWRQEAGEGLDADGLALIDQAVAWAEPRFEGQQALTGESLASHGAGVVRILAGMHTDAATRAAALLAALPTDLTAPAPALRNDPVAAAFGQEVARLVQGTRALLRLGVVARHASDVAAESGSQKEMQRKMLLAMAADLRIVLMRLASRLRTLRWHAESKTPCTVEFARETLDLYAPLANRLGIWQIKWEMEDLAFRFLEPDRYKQIARLLEEKRVEREAFIAGAIERLQSALAASGVHAEVSGRPKHIYSIWNKMRIKRLDFAQMYDLRALRVIVDDVRDCYTALGMVHEMGRPSPRNSTTIFRGPSPTATARCTRWWLTTTAGRSRCRSARARCTSSPSTAWPRTGATSEAGAKGGQVSASSEYDRQLSWMRQLLAWNSEVEAGDQAPVAPAALEPARPATRGAGKTRQAAAEPTQSDERIYVMMPQARVIELPAGATPVDFAYHLHTDLGHRCRGARVDGQMVPLQTRLSTGQTVEIISAKSGGPSRDWLNPQLGFLASPRARSKVRMWFNAIELQQRITQGQALVEKELQRLGKTAVNLEQLAQNLGFARADDLYVAAAKEEFSLRQIDALFQQPAPAAEPVPAALRGASAESAEKSGKSGCWWWAWVRC